MKRAGLTVICHDGVSYDANHISITRKYTEAGAVSMVNFLCSGSMVEKLASEVKEIAFFPAGVQHCSECDESIYKVVGSGIHESPH